MHVSRIEGATEVTGLEVAESADVYASSKRVGSPAPQVFCHKASTLQKTSPRSGGATPRSKIRLTRSNSTGSRTRSGASYTSSPPAVFVDDPGAANQLLSTRRKRSLFRGGSTAGPKNDRKGIPADRGHDGSSSATRTVLSSLGAASEGASLLLPSSDSTLPGNGEVATLGGCGDTAMPMYIIKMDGTGPYAPNEAVDFRNSSLPNGGRDGCCCVTGTASSLPGTVDEGMSLPSSDSSMAKSLGGGGRLENPMRKEWRHVAKDTCLDDMKCRLDGLDDAGHATGPVEKETRGSGESTPVAVEVDGLGERVASGASSVASGEGEGTGDMGDGESAVAGGRKDALKPERVGGMEGTGPYAPDHTTVSSDEARELAPMSVEGITIMPGEPFPPEPFQIFYLSLPCRSPSVNNNSSTTSKGGRRSSPRLHRSASIATKRRGERKIPTRPERRSASAESLATPTKGRRRVNSADAPPPPSQRMLRGSVTRSGARYTTPVSSRRIGVAQSSGRFSELKRRHQNDSNSVVEPIFVANGGPGGLADSIRARASAATGLIVPTAGSIEARTDAYPEMLTPQDGEKCVDQAVARDGMEKMIPSELGDESEGIRLAVMDRSKSCSTIQNHPASPSSCATRSSLCTGIVYAPSEPSTPADQLTVQTISKPLSPRKLFHKESLHDKNLNEEWGIEKIEATDKSRSIEPTEESALKEIKNNNESFTIMTVAKASQFQCCDSMSMDVTIAPRSKSEPKPDRGSKELHSSPESDERKKTSEPYVPKMFFINDVNSNTCAGEIETIEEVEDHKSSCTFSETWANDDATELLRKAYSEREAGDDSGLSSRAEEAVVPSVHGSDKVETEDDGIIAKRIIPGIEDRQLLSSCGDNEVGIGGELLGHTETDVTDVVHEPVVFDDAVTSPQTASISGIPPSSYEKQTSRFDQVFKKLKENNISPQESRNLIEKWYADIASSYNDARDESKENNSEVAEGICTTAQSHIYNNALAMESEAEGRGKAVATTCRYQQKNGSKVQFKCPDESRDHSMLEVIKNESTVPCGHIAGGAAEVKEPWKAEHEGIIKDQSQEKSDIVERNNSSHKIHDALVLKFTDNASVIENEAERENSAINKTGSEPQNQSAFFTVQGHTDYNVLASKNEREEGRTANNTTCKNQQNNDSKVRLKCLNKSRDDTRVEEIKNKLIVSRDHIPGSAVAVKESRGAEYKEIIKDHSQEILDLTERNEGAKFWGKKIQEALVLNFADYVSAKENEAKKEISAINKTGSKPQNHSLEIGLSYPCTTEEHRDFPNEEKGRIKEKVRDEFAVSCSHSVNYVSEAKEGREAESQAITKDKSQDRIRNEAGEERIETEREKRAITTTGGIQQISQKKSCDLEEQNDCLSRGEGRNKEKVRDASAVSSEDQNVAEGREARGAESETIIKQKPQSAYGTVIGNCESNICVSDLTDERNGVTGKKVEGGYPILDQPKLLNSLTPRPSDAATSSHCTEVRNECKNNSRENAEDNDSGVHCYSRNHTLTIEHGETEGSSTNKMNDGKQIKNPINDSDGHPGDPVSENIIIQRIEECSNHSLIEVKETKVIESQGNYQEHYQETVAIHGEEFEDVATSSHDVFISKSDEKSYVTNKKVAVGVLLNGTHERHKIHAGVGVARCAVSVEDALQVHSKNHKHLKQFVIKGEKEISEFEQTLHPKAVRTMLSQKSRPNFLKECTTYQVVEVSWKSWASELNAKQRKLRLILKKLSKKVAEALSLYERGVDVNAEDGKGALLFQLPDLAARGDSNKGTDAALTLCSGNTADLPDSPLAMRDTPSETNLTTEFLSLSPTLVKGTGRCENSMEKENDRIYCSPLGIDPEVVHRAEKILAMWRSTICISDVVSASDYIDEYEENDENIAWVRVYSAKVLDIVKWPDGGNTNKEKESLSRSIFLGDSSRKEKRKYVLKLGESAILIHYMGYPNTQNRWLLLDTTGAAAGGDDELKNVIVPHGSHELSVRILKAAKGASDVQRRLSKAVGKSDELSDITQADNVLDAGKHRKANPEVDHTARHIKLNPATVDCKPKRLKRTCLEDQALGCTDTQVVIKKEICEEEAKSVLSPRSAMSIKQRATKIHHGSILNKVRESRHQRMSEELFEKTEHLDCVIDNSIQSRPKRKRSSSLYRKTCGDQVKVGTENKIDAKIASKTKETGKAYGSKGQRKKGKKIAQVKDDRITVDGDSNLAFTWICTECREAECINDPNSPLLVCEGDCHRPFHYPCADLPTIPSKDEKWVCNDCKKRRHQCKICHEYVSKS